MQRFYAQIIAYYDSISTLLTYMVIPSHAKKLEVIKKTQYVKGENPKFLASLGPGWFFPHSQGETLHWSKCWVDMYRLLRLFSFTCLSLTGPIYVLKGYLQN